jgi:uncharacterized protein GlcG (DUF336 family)
MLLDLSKSSMALDVALSKARELNLEPLAVVVLDSGGNMVAMKREDGAGILRSEIAFSKAWGALGMGFGSRNLMERARRMPAFFVALASVSNGRVVPVPGGVLIRDDDGKVIGAVGVSGATSDQDELCAVAGIKAAGLNADPGNDVF